MSTTNTNTVGGGKNLKQNIVSALREFMKQNEQDERICQQCAAIIEDIDQLPTTPSSPVESPSCSGESLVTEDGNSDGASVVSLPCTSGNSIEQLKALYVELIRTKNYIDGFPGEYYDGQRAVYQSIAETVAEMIQGESDAVSDTTGVKSGNESPDNTPTPVSSEGGKH